MKKNSKTKKEIGIPHHGLSPIAKAKADESLRLLRFKRLDQMNDSKRLYATLLSLKYRIENYLAEEIYDERFSFGAFLKEYTAILQLKRKELANNLSIHETKFSRLIHNREDPNIEILYRIEAHSGNIISATVLYRLLTRKVIYELQSNSKLKKRQGKLVKNKVVV